MTDKQFEKIKKGLQFYSEGGIDNLCTMTETTLRTIIEDATKSLEAQIEKMKRCSICKHSTDLGYCKIRCNGGECNNMDKWEIKAND